MNTDTGPPQGNLKHMTPYPIAADPPMPKPIPDLVHPEYSLTQRAISRFSLQGKHAIGMASLIFSQLLLTEHSKSPAGLKASA